MGGRELRVQNKHKMEKKELVRKYIDDSIKSINLVYRNIDKIIEAAEIIIDSLKNGGKVLICGNGGSASQAQHFAGELVGRFEAERKGLACIALTTDTSIITSMANDYNFNMVFEREVESLGNKGDVLIGLSTSGNSENIIRAIAKAREKELKVITLIGKGGGKMLGIGDINLLIHAENTARIQEAHLLMLHILAKIIEDSFK